MTEKLTANRWRQSSHLATDRVAGEEWDRAPYNRWSFQHIRELVPTVEVWRGRGEIATLAEHRQDLGKIIFKNSEKKSVSVAEILSNTCSDGFIVIHEGRIVYEVYLNGMTERTLHLSQSVAKSVVASVAGVLVGRGLLDPQAPVTDYLPELTKTAYAGAKLQHVLDMTSGVRFGEEYTDRFSDIGMTDVASGWKAVPNEKPPGGDWPACIWDQILTLKSREAEHGSRFKYRSIETDVLAFCMERVSGQRLADLVSTLLWQPMGAEESACFTVDRSGYALADGGFNASLRDYARVGLVHLGMGTFNGRQILPTEWIMDIRRGAHGLFNDDSRDTLPNGCYRNQFWIEDASRETVMARGVFGQLIYISPEYNLVAVKLASQPDFINRANNLDSLAAIRAIAAELA